MAITATLSVNPSTLQMPDADSVTVVCTITNTGGSTEFIRPVAPSMFGGQGSLGQPSGPWPLSIAAGATAVVTWGAVFFDPGTYSLGVYVQNIGGTAQANATPVSVTVAAPEFWEPGKGPLTGDGSDVEVTVWGGTIKQTLAQWMADVSTSGGVGVTHGELAAEQAARIAGDAAEAAARQAADNAEAVARAHADQEIIDAGVPVALSGDSFVDGPGTTSRTLNDWVGDFVNVMNFGAVGNGVADDTAAIQAAVDYALSHNKVRVYLPPGTYKTSDTIHLGYGIGYSTVMLEGDGGFDTTGITTIKATFTDRPIVNIQGGRRSGIRRLHLYGPTTGAMGTPWTTSLAAAADPANYVTSGAKTAVNAPFCAVCIDGYGGTTPVDPYPRPPYPSFYGGSTPAVGSEYGRSTSSDTYIEECFFYLTVVGVCVQPNCDSNGDFLKLTNCYFNRHQVGVSYGNVNARSNDLTNCNFTNIHTMIDSVTYRRTSVGNKGNFAGNLSNMHANLVWRIFNVDLSWSVSTAIVNFYSENMAEIGVMTGTNSRVSFVGCSFELFDCKYSGTTVTETYPTVVLDSSSAAFYGCTFNFGRIGFAFKGTMPTFENCLIRPMVFNGDAYYQSAAEKLAATWFGGIFMVDDLTRPSGTSQIRRCRIVGTSAQQEYGGVDSDLAYTVHGRGVGYGAVVPYIAPTHMLRGDPGAGALPAAGRAQSGRGFTVITTDTMYQVGDVILLSTLPLWFYLESITDLGGGSYEHQWNALCYYTYSGGTYTPPAFSANLYYFPIGIRSPYRARFFKTTAGSPDVEYVDGTGASQNVGSNFDTTRKILWYGSNAIGLVAPLKPFASANVKINSIVGSTITMSQNAAITAWWADAPGLALVRLGA